MFRKVQNLSGGDKAILCILLFVVIALPIGIIIGLNVRPRNENRNLALHFDYGAFQGSYFEGDVVFKKDFEDVSLSMEYKPDRQYPAAVVGYILRLTDADGNEVTSVTAGVSYRFYAEAELESATNYTLYMAGSQVSNDPHVKLLFKAGNKTLYTVRY